MFLELMRKKARHVRHFICGRDALEINKFLKFSINYEIFKIAYQKSLQQIKVVEIDIESIVIFNH